MPDSPNLLLGSHKKLITPGKEAPGGWVITPPGVFCNAMVTSGSSLDKTCIGLEVGCKGRKKSEKENIYVFMVEAGLNAYVLRTCKCKWYFYNSGFQLI